MTAEKKIAFCNIYIIVFQLLASNAKKNIAKHEFMAVLSIFPVVKHLRGIRPDFDYTLEVVYLSFTSFTLIKKSVYMNYFNIMPLHSFLCTLPDMVINFTPHFRQI